MLSGQINMLTFQTPKWMKMACHGISKYLTADSPLENLDKALQARFMGAVWHQKPPPRG